MSLYIETKIRLSRETPRTARQLRSQILLTPEFSMVFWFTQPRHLLAKTGQTAANDDTQIPETLATDSLGPPRDRQGSQCLSPGLHGCLTTARKEVPAFCCWRSPRSLRRLACRAFDWSGPKRGEAMSPMIGPGLLWLRRLRMDMPSVTL